MIARGAGVSTGPRILKGEQVIVTLADGDGDGDGDGSVTFPGCEPFTQRR
ncbi:hypothetical protein [Streptomyces roseoverticillatus]|uniref:Uncharacterized protein n=1 Tax=Streptomyces roseoverticillatus TaxID=66429 RepID=A0ABV3ISX6_9ACTN